MGHSFNKLRDTEHIELKPAKVFRHKAPKHLYIQQALQVSPIRYQTQSFETSTLLFFKQLLFAKAL